MLFVKKRSGCSRGGQQQALHAIALHKHIDMVGHHRAGHPNLFLTTVAEKTTVLGVANLLRGEESAAAEAACPLLHQEKIVQLWRGILTHYHFSSICTASPGSGDMLLAAFDMKIPAACLCKNGAHMHLLQARAAAYASAEIAREGSVHYKSFDSCGMGLNVPIIAAKDAAAEDELDEEAAVAEEEAEEDAEAEEPDEEDAEAEEVENSEPEDDEEEVKKKKLPRKQKATAAATAAAAAIKHKAKAAGKPSRKTKAKQPSATLASLDTKPEAMPGMKRKAAQPAGSSMRNRTVKQVSMQEKLTAFRMNLNLPPAKKIPEGGDFSELLGGRGRGAPGRGARGRGAFPAY